MVSYSELHILHKTLTSKQTHGNEDANMPETKITLKELKNTQKISTQKLELQKNYFAIVNTIPKNKNGCVCKKTGPQPLATSLINTC